MSDPAIPLYKQGEQRTRVYFAHPYSAWERGSNENSNKIIRRFVPKGKSIAKVSEKEVKEIENWMSNYPRKILGYKTPKELVLEVTKKQSWSLGLNVVAI